LSGSINLAHLDRPFRLRPLKQPRHPFVAASQTALRSKLHQERLEATLDRFGKQPRDAEDEHVCA